MLYLEDLSRNYGKALLTLIQGDAGDRGCTMLKMRILLSAYPSIVDLEIPGLCDCVKTDIRLHLDILLHARNANDVKVATQCLQSAKFSL